MHTGCMHAFCDGPGNKNRGASRKTIAHAQRQNARQNLTCTTAECAIQQPRVHNDRMRDITSRARQQNAQNHFMCTITECAIQLHVHNEMRMLLGRTHAVRDGLGDLPWQGAHLAGGGAAGDVARQQGQRGDSAATCGAVLPAGVCSGVCVFARPRMGIQIRLQRHPVARTCCCSAQSVIIALWCAVVCVQAVCVQAHAGVLQRRQG